MTTVMEDRETLRSSFESFAGAQATSEPKWLRERRTTAFARYVEKGPPSPREEAWRHTPVAPLVRTRFERADPERRPDAAALARVPQEPAPSLLFVNGRLAPSGLPSTSGSAPTANAALAGRGVVVASLRELLRTDPGRIEPWLGRALAERGGVFTDLNTAFAEDGAVVIVPPGVVVDEPIHVAHVAAPDGAPAVAYLRTIVVVGRGSELRLVESFAGPAGRGYLVNAVTEVIVEDGARLDRYKLQSEGDQGLQVAALAAEVARDGRLLDHAVSLGAALSRNDIDVRLEGPGGECTLDGLFLLDGSRVADTHSRIDHVAPHCTSRQLYKGIVDGQGRGVFSGIVVVRPGAQKTDAAQTNKNLLLSRQALVHSIPQLEILADDVKCKHGSTTGQLDATALFYLRSRGIGEAAARGLLTWAFAADVLKGMSVASVRKAAEAHLQAHLPSVAELQEVIS